jgi:hypothetical protein
MPNRLTTLIAAGAAVLFVCLAGTTTLLGRTHPAHACTPPAAPTPPPGGWSAHHPWDSDQVTNAAPILTVGHRLGVPPRGWVIALATAMQESSLRNLPGGDRDSIGLFQQRPSQGWGTPRTATRPRLHRRSLLPAPARHTRLAAAVDHRSRPSRPTLSPPRRLRPLGDRRPRPRRHPHRHLPRHAHGCPEVSGQWT